VAKNNLNTQNPNVLFILVDQLRYDVFSHRGNKTIETPNIDALASSGAVFTDAICSSPLCGPSRASLLTGCCGSSGIFDYKNCEPDEPGPWLKEITTFDEILDKNGYHVEYHGKWHTGLEHREHYKGDINVFGHEIKEYRDFIASRYPSLKPNQEHKIDRYTELPYRPLPVDDMMAGAHEKGFLMPHHNEAGIREVADDHTLTAWTVNKAINFLKSKPPEPFCATCSILNPHAPLIANQKYANMFNPDNMEMPKNIGYTFEKNPPVPDAVPADAGGLGQFMQLYYALVKELDDHVGRLLQALRDADLEQNTLVIFTSDHGEMMGSHSTFSKEKFYEESLRVPLIMRLPGRIPEGLQSNASCSGSDIAPTILDYCGIGPEQHMHGSSLRNVIETGAQREPFAYSELYNWRCLRSTQWKYADYGEQGKQLFDLRNDPYELCNLLDKNSLSKEALEIKSRCEEVLTCRP
jgi:arylsulfatase A-like enzyme